MLNRRTSASKGQRRTGRTNVRHTHTPAQPTDGVADIIPYDAPDMDGSVCIEDNVREMLSLSHDPDLFFQDLFRYLVKPLKPHCKLVVRRH